MKKIKYFITALFGIFIINSCNTKDLELSNPNNLSPKAYFKTANQVQSAVNATYTNLQTQGLYSRHIFFALDNMAQENGGNSQLESNKRLFLGFTFDSGSDIVETVWGTCYSGINKANFVIENQDKINAIDKSLLDQATKNKFVAEAKFMRAYYYFLLVCRFGDLPIFTETTLTTKARSPKSEVYTLIESDLDYATKNLLSKDAEQKGRANKEAAFAYLGKVLLYQKKYEASLVALNEVKGFSLVSNFYDNFMEETEHGPESVFEVEYDQNLGTGGKWGSATSGEGANEATFRGQEYGNLGWYNVYPSDDLLNEYEPGDKRFSDTFYVPGSVYNNGKSTMRQDPPLPAKPTDEELKNYVDNFSPRRRAGWKKYQNYYKRTSENEDSSINFKVMRYSDILLMKAECLTLQAAPNFTASIELIKEVRTRAGLTTAITANKDAIFKALVHERKVEFAGEQLRFDDIIRWGIADKELKDTGFTAGKNELWPIPNRETSSNPNIGKQNQGY
jgi:starch-binding outer membrane protein, SusD/RagB family